MPLACIAEGNKLMSDDDYSLWASEQMHTVDPDWEAIRRREEERIRQDEEEERLRRYKEERERFQPKPITTTVPDWREEQRQLTLSQMIEIRRYEEQFHRPPPSIPHLEPLTAAELGLTSEGFALLHENLFLTNLPPLRTIFHDPSESMSAVGDGAWGFDAFCRQESGRAFHRTEMSAYLEDLPKVVDEKMAQEEAYSYLCNYITNSINLGLYAYNPNWERNLQNRFTKRLYSYYKNITFSNYSVINTGDAWIKIMQVMLAVQPPPEKLETYLSSIQSILGNFNSTMTMRGEFTGFVKPHVYLKRQVLDQLSTRLIQRKMVLTAWKDTVHEAELFSQNAGDPRVVEMRDLTIQIIEKSTPFFIEKASNHYVALLRSIAFGDKAISFESVRSDWLTAISLIPNLYVSSYSELWQRALQLAGATEIRSADPTWKKFTISGARPLL